jgi:hypothetical protein
MAEERKAEKIWLKILLVVFYLFIFAVLLRNSFAYLDPDFGWHLKMGEQTWKTLAVPDINHEDYTLFGTHWVDHEWLAEVLIYLACHYFGYVVLSIFFALLVLVALLIQLHFTRKYFLANDRGLLLALILQGFGVYACDPHLGIRIQELTILGLLILSIIIYSYNKNKNYRILFWLIPLFILWTSLHGGFLIGLFILGLFSAVKALELWSSRKFPVRFLDYGNVLKGKQIGIFAGFSFLAAAATLVNPYGLKLYEFLLTYRDTYYQSHIAEWQGQYFFPFVYPQLIYLEIVLIFLVLVFFGAFIFKREQFRKFDLYQTVLIVVLAVLAFQARRHFPLLFIISLPIMAGFFIDFFAFDFRSRPDPAPYPGTRLQALKRHWRNLRIPLLVFLCLLLIFAGAWNVLKIDFTNEPERAYQSEYPYQAVNFLKAHPEWAKLNILNDYAWGGYLIWQDPGRELFGDGRLPQYPLNGRTELEEYDYFFTPDKMLAQLDHYNIGLVLISPREDYPSIKPWEKWLFDLDEKKIQAGVKDGFCLLEYLKTSPQWRSVYNDGTAEIFVSNK